MIKVISAVSLTVILAGCSNSLPPEVIASSNASDPHTGIQKTGYQSIIGVYNHRTAINPKPWRKPRKKQPATEGESS